MGRYVDIGALGLGGNSGVMGCGETLNVAVDGVMTHFLRAFPSSWVPATRYVEKKNSWLGCEPTTIIVG